MEMTMDTTELSDLIMGAWGLIANAHPQPWYQIKADPDTPPELREWVEAAERWRDEQFHPWVGVEGDGSGHTAPVSVGDTPAPSAPTGQP